LGEDSLSWQPSPFGELLASGISVNHIHIVELVYFTPNVIQVPFRARDITDAEI